MFETKQVVMDRFVITGSQESWLMGFASLKKASGTTFRPTPYVDH